MPLPFANSVYRFTDPIRYFKANDPIYYEVDNIPLKQLQENDLWLKDQIEKLEYTQIFNTTSIVAGGSSPTNSSINRSQFLELKPFVNGGDNIVRVMAGRYTARINDAYNLKQLQYILQTGGQQSGQFNEWEFKTNIDSLLVSALNKFKTMVPSNALGMNGLYERAFTYAMATNDVPSQFLQKTNPAYSLNQPGRQAPYPGVTGRNIVSDTNVSSITSSYWSLAEGFFAMPGMESEFIKRWRGVTRTAVVDVPSILTISIPPFDVEDFKYENETGQEITLTDANQRIDLLFIYSKPIDTSSVTINQFDQSNNIPRKITSPVLGLVKGAGIGITSFRAGTAGIADVDLVDGTTPYGLNQIVPNISDQVGTNLGFSGYPKGSFPSPDDLMNLAPLLSEKLESDHIALIGQSILPIAYVIVKKNASLNANGSIILTPEDIIDIRPFFRTTELSYNERAGIAAATPQLSLANPVATEAYVDSIAKDIIAQIPTIPAPTTGTTGSNVPVLPTIVKTGYILGGVNYGPEGTLISHMKAIPLQGDMAEKLRSYYGYPEGRAINANPEWDLAHWCSFPGQPFPNPGSYRNDWINFVGAVENNSTDNIGKKLKFYPETWEANHAKFSGHFFIHSHFYVAKTLEIQLPNWAEDFLVNVQLFNCCPITAALPPDPNRNAMATHAVGPFVSKRRLSGNLYEFTIFVAWATHLESQPDNAGDYGLTFPTYYREAESAASYHRGNFNGFLVTTKGISTFEPRPVNDYGYGRYNSSLGTQAQGSPQNAGISLYPSVYFEIIALPNESGHRTNYLLEDNRRIVIP